jgi:lipid-binding SYLF domain-containing protein
MRKTLSGFIAVAALALSAPVLAADPAAQKAELRKMCDEALATLYKAKPAAKAEVEKAAGYGCFTSFGISFFVGGAGGRGLVHDNATKKTTYMNMGQATGGLDFGVKDYREVLVFKDKATLAKFVDKGWEFGGGGSAVAAAGGQGAKAEATEVSSSPITVYPMTKNGLAVGIAAGARKYWKDDDLNK